MLAAARWPFRGRLPDSIRKWESAASPNQILAMEDRAGHQAARNTPVLDAYRRLKGATRANAKLATAIAGARTRDLVGEMRPKTRALPSQLMTTTSTETIAHMIAYGSLLSTKKRGSKASPITAIITAWYVLNARRYSAESSPSGLSTSLTTIILRSGHQRSRASFVCHKNAEDYDYRPRKRESHHDNR